MATVNCSRFSGEAGLVCEELLAAQVDTFASKDDVNVFFTLWAAALVFMMHLGFAMLSAGSVRIKSTTNILMCIVLDACMCALAWWLGGWAFAYGGTYDDSSMEPNAFIGAEFFLGIGFEEVWPAHEWFFQFAFAATAATIVSGAVAERASFEAYLSYSFYLSFWVYPVVVHWVWGGGWLTINSSVFNGGPLLGVGAVDFAGCGPVHMIGGLAGAIGSKIIGPRQGRFDSDGNPRDIKGHSSPLAVLGTFVLWVGWFGFNPGSVLAITGSGVIAARAAVNTLLASASGGIMGMIIYTSLNPGREWNITSSLNGILAGLVSITAACAVVQLWAAIIIGAFGGLIYVLSSRFTLHTLGLDDPLDATPVHFFCGMWGLVATGFFASTDFVAQVGGFEANSPAIGGIFYGGNGSLLACQLIEILAICAWVAVFMTPYFLFLRHRKWLRISTAVENIGIDESSHGGAAYPELQEIQGSLAKMPKDLEQGAAKQTHEYKKSDPENSGDTNNLAQA